MCPDGRTHQRSHTAWLLANVHAPRAVSRARIAARPGVPALSPTSPPRAGAYSAPRRPHLACRSSSCSDHSRPKRGTCHSCSRWASGRSRSCRANRRAAGPIHAYTRCMSGIPGKRPCQRSRHCSRRSSRCLLVAILQMRSEYPRWEASASSSMQPASLPSVWDGERVGGRRNRGSPRRCRRDPGLGPPRLPHLFPAQCGTDSEEKRESDCR